MLLPTTWFTMHSRKRSWRPKGSSQHCISSRMSASSPFRRRTRFTRESRSWLRFVNRHFRHWHIDGDQVTDTIGSAWRVHKADLHHFNCLLRQRKNDSLGVTWVTDGAGVLCSTAGKGGHVLCRRCERCGRGVSRSKRWNQAAQNLCVQLLALGSCDVSRPIERDIKVRQLSPLLVTERDRFVPRSST